MSLAVWFIIIVFSIGILIALYDLWFYRNYEMWEDDDGFHIKKEKD